MHCTKNKYVIPITIYHRSGRFLKHSIETRQEFEFQTRIDVRLWRMMTSLMIERPGCHALGVCHHGWWVGLQISDASKGRPTTGFLPPTTYTLYQIIDSLEKKSNEIWDLIVSVYTENISETIWSNKSFFVMYLLQKN